jgi:uncharacterized membrane protein YfcA
MAQLGAALLGLLGGAVGGILGVGGGILFVPAIAILLGHSQLVAEATSLLAIVPVALVGAVRQRRHENVELGAGLLLGVLAIPGTAIGVVLANLLPERALELGFAALALVVAATLYRRALFPATASR